MLFLGTVTADWTVPTGGPPIPGGEFPTVGQKLAASDDMKRGEARGGVARICASAASRCFAGGSSLRILGPALASKAPSACGAYSVSPVVLEPSLQLA